MPKLEPRKLMSLAVQVMRKSLKEPRNDKKASPLVGAVLWKSNGTTETAYRGELRHGDHAEYTLLERKHPNERLDGSVLFATLEPCAPGARHHRKLSCAEHIVNARIKEVWVGIEDPDPTVDRKGIKYLQDNGVNVRMFDRDLQEAIRASNKKFIEQARERAGKANQGRLPKLGLLSKLEESETGFALSDLSEAALQVYRDRVAIHERVGTDAFNRRLLTQGLLRKQRGKLSPAGLAVVLFGRKPRNVLPQAGLNAMIEYADGTHEIRDFDGPTIMIPDEVESWLRNKLPSIIDRSRMARGEKEALPFESIREAVNNALVHRDYDVEGATCHLLVTSHTIVIKSPGRPPPPITIEQLQAFNAPMLNRNPKIQFVFAGTKLVEGRGLGMRTLRALAEKPRLPIPKYDFDGIYLTLTLYRDAKAATASLGAATLRQLSKSERSGWEWIATQQVVTSSEYATAMGLPNRTALNHLKRFTRIGLLRKTGSGPATRYQLT
jgi:ATP-dependent DNA helicase RecG